MFDIQADKSKINFTAGLIKKTVSFLVLSLVILSILFFHDSQSLFVVFYFFRCSLLPRRCWVFA